MGFTLQVADDGGGLTGAALVAHRNDHGLFGKLACRRLAKLLPSLVKDNGTAAVVDYALAEWLTSAFLRPEAPAQPGGRAPKTHQKEQDLETGLARGPPLGCPRAPT